MGWRTFWPKARRYPGFHLRMQAEATDLIEDGGRVGGLRATTPAGRSSSKPTSWSAPTAARSTVRRCAPLEVEDIGAPIDVLWMRLPRRPSDGTAPLGRFGAGKIFIMLDRGDYWQCAYVIPKGGFDEIELDSTPFGPRWPRSRRSSATVFASSRAGTTSSCSPSRSTGCAGGTVRPPLHRRPAHAMSPVGGVGINLAVQDAVAAANILAAPLRAGTLRERDLAAVERRRFPTRAAEMQVFMQNNLLARCWPAAAPAPPWPVRLIGAGAADPRLVEVDYPEHVRLPAVDRERGQAAHRARSSRARAAVQKPV